MLVTQGTLHSLCAWKYARALKQQVSYLVHLSGHEDGLKTLVGDGTMGLEQGCLSRCRRWKAEGAPGTVLVPHSRSDS